MKKRVLLMLMALVLMLSLVVPAFAAEPTVTVTADKTVLAAGETVKLTVNISEVTAQGLGVDWTYDHDVFEKVDAESKWLLSGAFMNDFAGDTASLAYLSATAVSGDALVLVLKAKVATELSAITYAVSFDGDLVSGCAAHNYAEIADEAFLKDAATCTKKAVYYKSCAECGAKSNDKTFEYGETLDHTYDKSVVDAKYLKAAANCTSGAVYYKSCVCGAVDKSEAAATFVSGAPTSHVYEEQIKDAAHKRTDASCTVKESYWFECTGCDDISTDKYFEVGNLLAHTERELVDAKYLKSAASCTAKAVYYKSCSVCEGALTATFESGEMLAHTPENAVEAKHLKSEANCTSGAVYYQSCKVCDTTLTATFVNGNPTTHSFTEKIEDAAHKRTDASCTVKESYWYDCSGCDLKSTDTYFEVGELLPHTERSVAEAEYLKSAASCTAKAVYYKSCSVCKGKLTATFESGEMLAHTPENAVEAKHLKTEANCTSGAVYYQSCKVCDTTLTELATFVNGNPTTHSFTEKIQDAAHKRTDASCTVKESYFYDCSGCDLKSTDKYFEVGNLLPHTERELVDAKYLKSAATCTAKAVYYKSCSVCEGKLTATFENGETLPHKFENEIIAEKYLKKAATCEDKGEYFKSCTVCGTASETDIFYVDALGHKAEWVDNETEDNKKDYYCAVCDTVLKTVEFKRPDEQEIKDLENNGAIQLPNIGDLEIPVGMTVEFKKNEISADKVDEDVVEDLATESSRYEVVMAVSLSFELEDGSTIKFENGEAMVPVQVPDVRSGMKVFAFYVDKDGNIELDANGKIKRYEMECVGGDQYLLKTSHFSLYIVATEPAAAAPHDHFYYSEWDFDANYHWKSCVCGHLGSIDEHEFKNGTCEVCGAKGTAAPETTKPVETEKPAETTKPAETEKPAETTETPAETEKPAETTVTPAETVVPAETDAPEETNTPEESKPLTPDDIGEAKKPGAALWIVIAVVACVAVVAVVIVIKKKN